MVSHAPALLLGTAVRLSALLFSTYRPPTVLCWLQAVGLLTEPEKEVIEAATYDIASIYELLRKAIDDAEEEPHAMVTKVGGTLL